jgi:hypothetical protein
MYGTTELTTGQASLTVFDKLLAFFFWLRHHPSMSLLALLCSVDVSTVCRFLRTIAAEFATKFAYLVTMPPLAELQQRYFLDERIIGALDGTDFRIAHLYGRDVAASDFYRGDKKEHFQLALILSDKSLRVVWAALGIPGHSNDQATYKHSNLFPWLAAHHQRVALLTDGGFTGPDLMRPVIKPVAIRDQLWNEIVRQERSGAEHCNCYLKHWEILGTTFHGSRTFHTLIVFSVIIIYNARLAIKETQK